VENRVSPRVKLAGMGTRALIEEMARAESRVFFKIGHC
jgi:hypothetical protein